MAHLSTSTGTFDPVLPSEFDASRLQSLSADKQHVFIFSWLSDLYRFLESLDNDGASAHQMFVKNELAKLIPLSTTLLTRPIRVLTGKCYYEIFSKGDRKTLFDVINDHLNAINNGKSDKNIESKLFLVYAIGDIFAAGGESILAMAAHAILSLTRLIRGSSNNAGYRSTIFHSISQVVSTTGSFFDENLGRDLWKIAKNATTDKSYLVRVEALNALKELFRTGPHFNNVSDLDGLRLIVLKAFDTPQALVRKSAAACWATALSAVSTTITSVVEVPAKKSKKRENTQSPQDEGAPPQLPQQPTKKVVQHITYTFEDAVRHLATAYTKTSVSTKIRAGIIETYTELFFMIGTAEIEANYLTITKCLLDDVLSNSNITNNRFRNLTARRHVQFLLHDVIGQQLLGETGRIASVKILVNEFLKNYPTVMKDQYEPSKYALTGAINALKYFIEVLGSGILSEQASLRDALLLVLQHSNYTVQIAACSCIRAFVLHAPAQLVPVINAIMNNLNRDIAVLRGRRSSHDVAGRCVGFANGLASVIAITNLRPQYASLDLTFRLFSLATSLLKSSGDVDVRVSTTQIQVAWTLISGLMSLGPNFVKLHLNQLLLLWKSALPKPLSKDSVADKNSLEYSFLLHVRECALSSIFVFLLFNAKLVTNDVSKRLIVMLQNTTAFSNLIISKRIVEDPNMRLSLSLHLEDYERMVQRRVFQCYIALIDMNHGDGLPADILTSAISLFADSDNYSTSPLSTTIAANAGSFESIWDVVDNYAYGINSFIREFDVVGFEKKSGSSEDKNWLNKNSFLQSIERALHEPTIGAQEHDYVHILRQQENQSGIEPWHKYPKTASTAVVDYSIELFARLLPLQVERVQQSILEQLASFLGASSLSKDPGRKAAITANTTVALSGTLKLLSVAKSNQRLGLQGESVLKIINEILGSIAIVDDASIRLIAADALGRLCAIGNHNFTAIQVKKTVDSIVNIRDPNARAGLALVLGYIHSHVGGIAAGFYLKTMIGILMSLSSDPHPTVHYWALAALSIIAESAGLTFSSYTSSTIGMICTLYLSDTHNLECSSVLSSNLEMDHSTVEVLAHCIDALVGVLGPDLQDTPKNRELIGLLIHEQSSEEDPFVVVEAIKCYQHAILFAPRFFNIHSFCIKIAKYLNSPIKDLRDAVIDGYYQLAQTNVNEIFRHTGRGLESLIWLSYDMTPWHEGLKSIIRVWLSQTGISEARAWVSRVQAIQVKLVDRKSKRRINSSGITVVEEPDLGDEEVASFAAAESGPGSKSAASGNENIGEPLKWQTRVFALVCLEKVLAMNRDTPENLIVKISDIIRSAFSASTATVLEMRIMGVQLLDDILQTFGSTADPEFPEFALLEQYQAQIASALTPAFAVDSSPELAAKAIKVCANFIASGIVQDVAKMGRILKLLTNALESLTAEGGTISLGDLKVLNGNAQIMLKLAILSAWAELEVASADHDYLLNVIAPHIEILAPLWLSALRDFAQLRFEPETGGNGVNLNGDVGGGRDSILQVYESTWLKLVTAIAELLEQSPDLIISALNGSNTLTNEKKDETNDGPAAFFFVLFGICFEALVKAPNGDTLAKKEEIPEILQALKKILIPEVCGNSIYQELVFAETIDLFDRTLLTETYNCQDPLLDILRNLCLNHPNAKKGGLEVNIGTSDRVTDGINQMFELLRGVITVLVLIHPSISDFATNPPRPLTKEAIFITRKALDAVKDMIECFPVHIRIDLYASVLHIYSCFLETPSCQEEVIQLLFQPLKDVLRNIVKSCQESDSEIYTQLLQEIRSFWALLISILERTANVSYKDGILLRKNVLLSMVVVISSCDQILSPSDSLIEDCCNSIVDAFNDPNVLPVASQCAKSLLLTSSRSSFTQMFGQKLLPQLVALATRDEDISSDSVKISELICEILVEFTKSLDSERIAPAMAICIPAILFSAKEDKPLESQKRQLVELAGIDGLTFKNVAANLTTTQRFQLERILRSRSKEGTIADEDDGDESQHGPTIELKMNFGF
ncbi:armadillo-type protein [Lipomyces japonicus]|uniref:armadillo-type protein n=1 Tax=Lipomyces japonicus TaxID=56871 RepID=UPI0034CF7162